MDLPNHRQFLTRTEPLEPGHEEEGARFREISGSHPDAASAIGPALLLEAWAALQSAHIEAVDLHLKGGTVIHRAVRLALLGPVARASTRRDGWSHLFPVSDLVMVRLVPRGGWRS